MPHTKNKVVIITAAGKGMGAMCAHHLHHLGYQVGLLSPSGSAEKLALSLGGVGVTGSISNKSDLKKLVDATMERFGRIDAVVNNTGHPPKGDLLEISDNDWHQGLDILLMNVIHMCQLVVPIMQKQGGGSIVNISTAAIVEPNLKFPVSSAIRAGLAAYCKMFAERYAKDNIRINSVLPGMIDTFPVMPEFVAKIPMGRYGTADEIAKVIAFLVSSDSAYMTGQNLIVDGGLTRAL